MRDLFEDIFSSPPDPVLAARRALRPIRRTRFYERVTVGEGNVILLDDKPVRTPARRTLAAPLPAPVLAAALAAEWDAQSEFIDPAKMPLTRLANSIIDDVVLAPEPVELEVAKYLASDLVCYRAGEPPGLAVRQARHWDPVLDWARDVLGATFTPTRGVIHVTQPQAALASAGVAIPRHPWRLGAVHVVTTLTGSALLALALARGRWSTDEVWQAAHVDEDWNMEQWGRDEMALERRAFRFAEMQAAATVLAELDP